MPEWRKTVVGGLLVVLRVGTIRRTARTTQTVRHFDEPNRKVYPGDSIESSTTIFMRPRSIFVFFL